MSKIILSQINPIAGDIEYNSNKIIDCIKRAKNGNAEMIIFPELALAGYPFGDIYIRHSEILEKQLKALNSIVKETENITALVGFIELTGSIGKKPFYNSVAIIQNGKITNTVRKRLLPNYNEFNDYRYFEPYDKPSQVFELNGERYGVLICEDGFNDKTFFKTSSIYDCDPIEELMQQNPTVLINCSCSPTRCGKEYVKNAVLSSVAKKYAVNYIYVNQVCYADNLCYDGASRIYNQKGELSLRAKSFEEDFIPATDFKGIINPIPKGSEEKQDTKKFNPINKSDLERTYKSTVFGIKEYFNKNGFKKAVLGLSGGLDSSVCAVLLADALGKENVWGISMPSKITSQESKTDAKMLAENLGINFSEIPIPEMTEAFKITLDKVYNTINAEKYAEPTTTENLQARIRATLLWSISNEYKQMLPIATSDKSEAYIGYATVNGDMSGGFAPISDITKSKLFALAAYLNENRKEKNVIPKSVLEKRPGAELKLNPKTGKPVCAEEENMPYEFLDEIIMLVENSGYGFNNLINHKFFYEENNPLTIEEKTEMIKKFYKKSQSAVFKWHIMPPGIITDSHSINSAEYRQPVISKIY